jgi:uncharacterized membrane protein YccF (DUF307 family)
MNSPFVARLKHYYDLLLPVRRVLWVVLGGWALALFYFMGALAFLVTIIGAPLALEAAKVGTFAFCPIGFSYGKKLDRHKTVDLVCNIIWAVLIGWSLVLMHLTFAIVNALTIIGIGNAWQHIRLIPLALMPFGKAVFLPKVKTTAVETQSAASMV